MRRDFLPWHHHPEHAKVVVPVRVDPTGRSGPTPKAARHGGWRRVAPGWFVPSSVDPGCVDQRIVEAAVRLGSYGAVTGWASLGWRGGRWFQSADRIVTLATGDAGLRPAVGVSISEERLLPHHIEVVDGLRATSAVRSVLFEMRYAPDVVAATEVLDMACYDDLVSIEEAQAYAAELGTWTGIPQARTAIALADENAWSPAEAAPRIVWRASGLGTPHANLALFNLEGHFLCTPDLIDPDAGVVGEYDVSGHLERGQQVRDRDRDALYRRLGLEQVTWLASDRADPALASARLREAYAAAAARPAADRAWTISPPSWWRPTRTVAQRRALSLSDRARFLRYREWR